MARRISWAVMRACGRTKKRPRDKKATGLTGLVIGCKHAGYFTYTRPQLVWFIRSSRGCFGRLPRSATRLAAIGP